MNGNLDDYDFTPTANSTLASIFDSSSELFESSSLTYTAPKQPKPGAITDAPNDSTKTESAVICAKVVQVWKLVDAKYSAVGKLGLAVIGSQTSHEIILYKDKRNVIMRTKIFGLEVSSKRDHFVSFDSKGDNWLLKFNNQEDSTTVIYNIEKYGGKIITLEPQEPTSGTNADDEAKADILTRIAKMGQSILPSKNMGAEEESVHASEVERNHSVALSTTLNTPNIPTTLVMSHPVTYDPMNLYVAENRAHNSEVRINLAHISDKLNQLMDQLKLDTSRSKQEALPDVSKSKIKVLELKNENFVRELTLAQEENLKLKHQIKEFSERKHVLEMKEQELQKREALKSDLSQLVEAQKSELEELRNNLLICEEKNIELRNEISKLQNTVSDLQLKLKNSEERQIQDNTVRLPQQEIKDKVSELTTMLKEEMNGMYASITGTFVEDQPYISEMRNIIAQNIKSTTLKIIQNFQQIYNMQSEPS